MPKVFANRIHYLSQVVTMIWDAIDNIGYISISWSTLVCGISVIGMTYHIGYEDTERNCKLSYHIRKRNETPNKQYCHVYYTVYYTRVSVKFVAEIKGLLTFFLDAKTYALVNEFDNHNFKKYFSGNFRCLVDQHDEIRNRFCFGNGLKLQGNKSEPQSLLTQYIQSKFVSLGHYKTRSVISVWCTGLHEHNTDQLCLCSDKTGVP